MGRIQIHKLLFLPIILAKKYLLIFSKVGRLLLKLLGNVNICFKK
jgi:hypothetical protein